MIFILFLPVSIFIFIIVVLMVFHIIKSWNAEGKISYKKINEIMYTVLILAFCFYYPFLILKFGGTRVGIVFPNAVDELIILGNLFIFGVMLCIVGWAISAKMRTKRNPELLNTLNNYEVFCDEVLKEYTKKNRLMRKITHLLPFGVVSIIIIIFNFFQFLLGNTWVDYALFFALIIGIDFALTFVIQDLIRLFDFSYMPPKAIKMCRAGLTPDELDTFSSTSVMVFGFAFFVFFSFPIFFVILLVSSVADAMASIFGILASEKKHKFPKGTDKSIEGYFGGFIFAFICSVFGVLFSNAFGISNWSLELALILAIILAIMFVGIDIVTSKVKLQDNYLNSFVIGLVAIIALISMQVPIF